MFLVYNLDVLSETDFCLSPTDRAFQYGDGLFETIRYENGRIWFWSDHFARLTAGMAALHLNLSAEFTAEAIYKRILDLISANTITNQTARIKLQVWRKPGGLYTPSSTECNLLITAQLGNFFSIGTKPSVGIYSEFRVYQSPASAYKTLNSLPYVMAGLYKQERGFDDVILLDNQGNLAECLASNLFWYGQNTLFTPSLQTGCINGILRQQLLRLASQNDIIVREVVDQLEILKQAEVVFCTNVMGIQWIRSIDDIDLPLNAPAEALLNALFAQLHS
ncbi:aminotransferase class IV [Spirosoma harenae]